MSSRAKRAATHVAGRQHGVITWEQAARAGLTKQEVRTLIGDGLWTRRCREVFLVAGSAPTFERDVMAACLAGGPHAVACRGTVARLLGLGRPWFDDAPVEILLPRPASRRGAEAVGAVVHLAVRLDGADRACTGPIPVTSGTRLLVDLLSARPVDALFAVADDVFYRRWATPASVRRRWSEVGGRHRHVLDAVLLPWGPGPRPGSPKEMALARVLQLHGLPRPARQHEVRIPGGGTRYLDLAYPDAKVAPEYDGRRPHGERRWAADAEREDELASLGWLRLPAGAADLVEPGATAYCDQVRAALQARGRR